MTEFNPDERWYARTEEAYRKELGWLTRVLDEARTRKVHHV